MAEDKKLPERKKVKVKLIANHTHERKDYKAGDEVEVFQDQIAWLENAGVIAKKKEG